MNGAAWEHSRAIMRPSFTRNSIAKVEVYERHLQHLFRLIPRDGSTVDLQDLFFGLVRFSFVFLIFLSFPFS